jgi:RraA family protein
MTVGFRIRAEIPDRVAPALCARAAKLPAAVVGDVAHRMQTMRGGFRACGKRRALAGPAFTVRARPGDNLMLHRAIDLALSGDVIVCDGAGELGIALMGDHMASHAARREIAGFVVDGAVRDLPGLASLDLGVWARGVTPQGPYKDGPGEIGYPIACGGLAVLPGDLVLADEEGVVVIPRADAATVVEAAEVFLAKEIAAQEAIDAGAWDRAWVERTLAAKGCTTD